MSRSSIQRMYEEIVAYGGNFGDPIAIFVDFEPLPILVDENADQSLRRGASVALLVNLAVTLDNGDPESALRSSAYRELDAALNQGLLSEFPAIEASARLATCGEERFFASLLAVYLNCVKPNVA